LELKCVGLIITNSDQRGMGSLLLSTYIKQFYSYVNMVCPA